VVIGAPGPVAAILPSASATSRLRPVGSSGVTLTDGFWLERLRINRERTIPHGLEQLKSAGNLHDLRLAAGTAKGPYQALGIMFDKPFPFLDSDVYKWLEAVGWELGRAPEPALLAAADEVIGLVADAQRPDGYINSFVEVVGGGRAYQDLAWGHELYCIGHLIQAAVAWKRALDDDRLLHLASRAADSVEAEFGPRGRLAIEGHPEIEMALVELFRTTGESRYLDLAARLIEARGRGLLGEGRFGAAYWQDHAPVRDAPEVAGHVVRQLYLDCGAVDVASETGDGELLDAVLRRWKDMLATRTYLTGGVGSRYTGEAFGDPFELPPDLAYTETCGAIASGMLASRLLLVTGDPACADALERAIYNGVLPGISLEGTRFFYVNALQRRTHRVAAGHGTGERASWYPCACCPPNVMRVLATWPQQVATLDDSGVQLQQYAAAEIRTEAAGEPVRLKVDTAYPWNGSVTVTILETPQQPWTLSMRVPAWAGAATFEDETGVHPVPSGERSIAAGRGWRPGDSVTLTLDTPPRVTEAHPRVDAVRGCVALERGPLVYCVETADLPTGIELEEVRLQRDADLVPVPRADIGDSIVGLHASAVAGTSSIAIDAIPYFAWANREVEAMRVWIPRESADEALVRGGVDAPG
jgi:DUF1680 family protein